MKINKVIFGVNDSYFLEFWPLQSKICREILGLEPVLFYISEEESDFYHDGYGLVKKIKKVDGYNTGLLSCIVRLYGTKYFPEDVCITGDLDMLMINKKYFIEQVENFSEDSLVIYTSDAYDLNRPEVKELFDTEPFPFKQEMYNYPYFAAKGKVFDKVVDTNCSFEYFVKRHENYKSGYKFMWMIDEFYFSDCVNYKEHGIEIHKLRRGFTSPWIADKRINRHNFPVQLEWENEVKLQNEHGFYDKQKLIDGYYIDVNCCRPYSKYKNVIDELVDIVLKNSHIKKIKIDNRTELCDLMDKHGSDKSSKPNWVQYQGHNYTRFYHQIFQHLRVEKFNLFELGLGSNNPEIPSNMGVNGHPGASLRGWKEYFINAEIFGADIDKNILFQEDRIKTFFCDQTDSYSIKEMWSKIPENFDLIIDDGLHQLNANLNFFENSIHKLNYGGYYIIEDVISEELPMWKQNIEKFKNIYKNLEFEIVSVEWTHNDNNLIVIKKKQTNTNDFYKFGMELKNDKVTHHRYDLIYNIFLEKLRDKKIKVFEIGLGHNSQDTGNSRALWKNYFPNCELFVMDINYEFEDELGYVFKGDQSKIEDLKEISSKIGKVDLIIDDGSHVAEHQAKTFDILFENSLNDGGVYIIEDIECTYWNPQSMVYGYETGHMSIIQYLTSFLDEINDEFSKKKNKLAISSITFFKNCILIIKQTEEEKKISDKPYRFNHML